MNNLAVLSLVHNTDFRNYHPIANLKLFVMTLDCGS
jgi:hypothetical protein